MTDKTRSPPHYARMKIQPGYFIMENNLPYDVGNVIKYVCRYDAKNGLEDLEKARGYLDMMIDRMRGKADYVPGQEVPYQGPKVSRQPTKRTVYRDAQRRVIVTGVRARPHKRKPSGRHGP